MIATYTRNTHGDSSSSNNKFKPLGGNLHTLLDSMKQVNVCLEKEIKWHQQESGKHKCDEPENAKEKQQKTSVTLTRDSKHSTMSGPALSQ
jgi:putative salt-induced outer membrane protein YdiY